MCTVAPSVVAPFCTSRHLPRERTEPSEARCQVWLVPPKQVHICGRAPSAVELPVTSRHLAFAALAIRPVPPAGGAVVGVLPDGVPVQVKVALVRAGRRSEEHTSELQ